MIRLAKYLKPYLGMIVVAVVLLFVQANADLALPDYLSRIVNVGIQQGGVDNAVPTAMRASQMDHLGLFLSAADQQRVLSDYTLVNSASANYPQTLQTVPGLANEPVYVLAKGDAAETAWLNPVMSKALLAVAAVQQVMTDPARAAQLSQVAGFDLSQLPAGTDLFAMLARIPAAQRATISAAISAAMEKQLTALGASAVQQAAIGVTIAEYKTLGMDTAGLQTNYILSAGLLMLLITLVSVAGSVGVGYLSARTGAGFARDVRRAIFHKVENFSSTEFDRFSTASLITRTTNDVTQIQMLVIMSMRMIIYAPIIGVGGILRAIGKDSSMWWTIALAVGALLVLVTVVFSLSLPKFRIMQKLVDRLNLVVRENLSGLMVVRAFNRQPFEEQRFETANQDLTGTNLFVNRVMAAMFPTMNLIVSSVSLLIIWVGADQVAQSRMQVGDMMAFMQYAMLILMSFLMMSMMFIMLPRASVSGDRIADVLAVVPAIRDSDATRHFPAPFTATVEFRGVAFRYPGADENVLCDINFIARPGQTTALIGSTGSGKSTVINLVPRFYDVTEGQILIDGVDIRQVTQHELREKIGYIPQHSTLFSGTIDSNLRYSDENATEADIRTAADTAQVTEFIDSSADGLATPIAQGGSNVSGGQKQRLSIARALVKRAPIYIFDDSFSALDFKTDAALRRALKETSANSTVLLVTQRVSTVMNAEQIVVLDEGIVVGKGTHAELMTTCETYREIALSQLSQEELS